MGKGTTYIDRNNLDFGMKSEAFLSACEYTIYYNETEINFGPKVILVQHM